MSNWLRRALASSLARCGFTNRRESSVRSSVIPMAWRNCPRVGSHVLRERLYGERHCEGSSTRGWVARGTICHPQLWIVRSIGYWVHACWSEAPRGLILVVSIRGIVRCMSRTSTLRGACGALDGRSGKRPRRTLYTNIRLQQTSASSTDERSGTRAACFALCASTRGSFLARHRVERRGDAHGERSFIVRRLACETQSPCPCVNPSS